MAFLLVSCEKTDTTVIEPLGNSPFIVAAKITPDTINTDTINVGTERKPEDVLSLHVKAYATITHPISLQNLNVTARVFRENSSSPLSTIALLDDGQDIDDIMGDGIFSGLNSFEFKRSEIGTFRVEVASEDEKRFKSNNYILPLVIVRQNQPPTISNLTAPDTIRLGTQVPNFLLTVQAADPDGLQDIRQVVFNSFLPNGQPSGNNPFRLYDDGTNGDVTNGNGTYSLRISSPTNTGNYRFEFQAFDRSNENSNIIIHTIIVIP